MKQFEMVCKLLFIIIIFYNTVSFYESVRPTFKLSFDENIKYFIKIIVLLQSSQFQITY